VSHSNQLHKTIRWPDLGSIGTLVQCVAGNRQATGREPIARFLANQGPYRMPALDKRRDQRRSQVSSSAGHKYTLLLSSTARCDVVSGCYTHVVRTRSAAGL
jgi:hypothetical protein